MQTNACDPAHTPDDDLEWRPRARGVQWWCAEGVLHSDHGLTYAFQCTLLTANARLLHPTALQLSLTDWQTGQHFDFQQSSPLGFGVELGESRLRFGERAEVLKTTEGLQLRLFHSAFSLTLSLGYGQGGYRRREPDEGAAAPTGEQEPSPYAFAYPTMPAGGYLTVAEETMPVTGSVWFFGRNAPFAALRPQAHWERFHLWFDDGDRLSLTVMPRLGVTDGMWLPSCQSPAPLTDVSVRPLRTAEAAGLAWSCAWEAAIPGVKAGCYGITPLFNGHLRFGCFEQLCAVTDPQGYQVGLCFTQALFGVRNPGSIQILRDLLRTVET